MNGEGREDTNPSPGSQPDETSSNAIESQAFTGDLVQARDVQGGIHLYAGAEQHRIERVVPRQLPGDVRIFVNRDRELAFLRDAAESGTTQGDDPNTPLVLVITGTAGVGKTALALRWAHTIRGRFVDGDLYVNLRGYDDGPPLSASTVLDRILRDLSVPPSLVPGDLDARANLYRSLVSQRRLLVFLDNASSASQVRPLIPGTPESTVVVTGRSQLSGLVIRDSAQRIELRTLEDPDSVQLLERVLRDTARSDDPADLAELARLCANLPLALRIAAERAASRPMTSLQELIDDLRDDSALWDALSIDDELGEEGVRTVFAWSYRALPEDAAAMFRAVGMHPPGAFSLPVAAAAANVTARAARRQLDILLGAFLVESTGPNRYQLHDLLRAYALDQARTVDTAATRDGCLNRILEWYIRTADRAARRIAEGDRFPVDDVWQLPDELLTTFESTSTAVQWFEVERHNLVAAVRTASAAGVFQRSWQLAMVLGSIYAHQFTFDDWEETADLAIAAAERLNDQASYASALNNKSMCAFRQGDLDNAAALQREALALRRELEDEHGQTVSLNLIGLIELRARNLTAAGESFRSAIEIATRLGDRRWEAICRANLAQSLLEADDASSAYPLVADLPEQMRELGEVSLEGNALWLAGWALRLLGELEPARQALRRALDLADDSRDRVGEAFWLIEAARIHLAAGRFAEALAACHTSASLQRQIGDDAREALALGLTGEVLRASGDAAGAMSFFAHAARVHRRLADPWAEATSLVGVADCLNDLGRRDQERAALSQAVTLLGQFSDGRANQLREATQRRLR